MTKGSQEHTPLTEGSQEPAPRKKMAIADGIARELGETTRAAISQIRRTVYQCGPEQALAWLEATRAYEAAGGMLVKDGSRRRTPGGVYFAIVSAEIAPQLHAVVFPPWQTKRAKKEGQLAASQAATPAPAAAAPATAPAPVPVPPFDWDVREQLVTEASETKGVLSTVKITLIGRPGKVVERPGFVLLVLEKSGPLPALPKGIPVPASAPSTQYIVYVGSKQWTKVKEAIKQPEDALIIEGTPILDPKFNAITVFATNVTTKQPQQAQKEGRAKNDVSAGS